MWAFGIWLALAAILGSMPIGAHAEAPSPVSAPATAKPVALDHLTVHRLDLVDDKGIVRLTIAAPTPDPVIGGKAYRRAFPGSGIVIYDAQGNERGGLGIADVPGGSPVLALDHDNVDAIGWRVLPDGSIKFGMSAKPPEQKDSGGHVVAAKDGATPIQLIVGPDGSPSLVMTDKQDRPRVRLTVTNEGYGALEFLDAAGRVVGTYAPENNGK